MKKKGVTMLIALILPMLVMGQSTLYEKYSEMKEVSSVYISKTMLELNEQIFTQEYYIGKVSGQLDGIYLISSQHEGTRDQMRTDIRDFIKKGNYEDLMRQKGTRSETSFYVKRDKDNIKELIMTNESDKKINFIQLVGELTLKDLKNITMYNQGKN